MLLCKQQMLMVKGLARWQQQQWIGSEMKVLEKEQGMSQLLVTPPALPSRPA